MSARILCLLLSAIFLSGCGGLRRHHPNHGTAEFPSNTTVAITDDNDHPIGAWLEDPPIIYGEELDSGKKYILLIAGDEVSERVIVDMGPPVSVPNPIFGYYDVVHPNHAPPQATRHATFSPVASMASAWAGLLQRYTSRPYRDAGWELIPIRALSADSINAALDNIKDLNPLAVAVHYFGHGDAIYNFSTGAGKATTRPYLSLRGHSVQKFRLPNPNGTSQERYLTVPDANNISRYFVDALVGKLQTDFPGIPVVLILDGCELAQSLDLKAGLSGMAVSVDRVYCGSNLGVFSSLYSSVAVPTDFDQFTTQMPATLATVNNSLRRYTVSYVDKDRALRGFTWLFTRTHNPPQEASHDHWRYPWD